MLICRIVSSQIYGPNYCLLPRLDVVPCQNFFPILPTPDPGEKYVIISPELYYSFSPPNVNLVRSQFSIYRTTFARGPAGLPICYPVGPPENMKGVQDIVSIGNAGQVKFLISPGIDLEQPVP